MTTLVQELADQGKGVLMVLHDLNQALTCADQIIVMERGCIVCSGTAEEVSDSDVLSRVFQVTPHRIVLENGQTQYLFTK